MREHAQPVTDGSDDAYGAELRPGERSLGSYAASGAPSRGRLFPEPDCPTRNALQRDRDRIIHSTAFRRLTYKTQVFVVHEGDHYRNRLTHSLEVAQIARTIARQLRLDEDLAETLALAHDLGHPPFGHAGEGALNECSRVAGGFDHNVQSFRLVTKLERKYPSFDGLNLTWETLEGLIKHNGPPAVSGTPRDERICQALASFDAQWPLALDKWPSAEAQAAALSDDIAWMTHDIDDGLRAGLVALDALKAVPFLKPIIDDIEHLPSLDSSRYIYGITRRLITVLIADAVDASRTRLKAVRPRSPDDIRNATGVVVTFSTTTEEDVEGVKAFLFEHLYRHPRVVRVMDLAQSIVHDLMARYRRDAAALPQTWRDLAAAGDEGHRIRTIADFVAGMTDRYAIAEHRRLFDATPELR